MRDFNSIRCWGVLILCGLPLPSGNGQSPQLTDQQWTRYVDELEAATKAIASRQWDEAARRLETAPPGARGLEHGWLAAAALRRGPVVRGIPKPDGVRALYATLDPIRNRVVYVCEDGACRMYDLDSLSDPPQKLADPRGKPLFCAAFSRDGAWLATGNGEGDVVLWKLPQGAGEPSEHVAINTGGGVRTMAISPDGKRLAAEGKDGIFLWDLEKRQPLTQLAPRTRFASPVRFSYDGSRVATGGMASIEVYDGRTGEQLKQIAHAPYTMHVAFGPTGKFVATGNRGSIAKRTALFEVASGQRLFDETRHSRGVTGLLFLPGSRLVSTAGDGLLHVQRIPSGRLLWTLDLGHSIYKPAASADGRILIWNHRRGVEYVRADPPS